MAREWLEGKLLSDDVILVLEQTLVVVTAVVTVDPTAEVNGGRYAVAGKMLLFEYNGSSE